MSKLYIGNSLVSDMVRTSSPLFEGDTVVSFKTLDGKKHIQQIGTPAEHIEIACLLNETNKELLDTAFKQVSLMSLQRYGIEYTGYIEETPSYEQVHNSMTASKRIYRAEFKLSLGDDI